MLADVLVNLPVKCLIDLIGKQVRHVLPSAVIQLVHPLDFNWNISLQGSM